MPISLRRSWPPALAVAAVLGVAPGAGAATFEVTRTDDPLPDGCLIGDCSLREATLAAADAAGGDEIVLRAGPGPYSLAQLSPLGEDESGGLRGDLDIDGGGVRISRVRGRQATIDARGIDRALDVGAGGGLTLSRLTVVGGASPAAGGAIRAAANLSLRRVTLRENSALDAGGALAVQAGTTRVKGSTINENVAGRGGAVAVEPGARLLAVNATFAGNRSYAGGGAISAGGRVGLNAVTVARNFADLDADGTGAGGGLATEIGGGYVVENSLIAQNRLGTGVRSDCSGGFDSDGDNLLRARDPAGCTGFDFAGDIFTARPRIGFLRKNGGPTQTIALKRRSPALDEAGPQSSPRRDQRDVKRGRLPDIGAYERVVADRRGA